VRKWLLVRLHDRRVARDQVELVSAVEGGTRVGRGDLAVAVVEPVDGQRLVLVGQAASVDGVEERLHDLAEDELGVRLQSHVVQLLQLTAVGLGEVHPGVPNRQVVELEVEPAVQTRDPTPNPDRLTVLRGLLEVHLARQGDLLERTGHAERELVDEALLGSVPHPDRRLDLVPEGVEVRAVGGLDDVGSLVEAGLLTHDVVEQEVEQLDLLGLRLHDGSHVLTLFLSWMYGYRVAQAETRTTSRPESTM